MDAGYCITAAGLQKSARSSRKFTDQTLNAQAASASAGQQTLSGFSEAVLHLWFLSLKATTGKRRQAEEAGLGWEAWLLVPLPHCR